MIQFSGGRRQAAACETRGQATGRCAIIATALLFMLLAGCASLPDPKPGMGQILVQLRGEPREGVTGPKTREVQEEYSRSRESIEQGKAFERVDYDEMEDVVVVLTRADGLSLVEAAPNVVGGVCFYEFGEDGFDHRQLAYMNWGQIELGIRNLRDEALDFFFIGDGGDVFDLTVPAGKTGTILLPPDMYTVECDQELSVELRLFVCGKGLPWRGPSSEYPFFDNLEPGEYEVTVYPPRLPEITRTITVTAGKRETVTAELTVNDLPEVGE